MHCWGEGLQKITLRWAFHNNNPSPPTIHRNIQVHLKAPFAHHPLGFENPTHQTTGWAPTLHVSSMVISFLSFTSGFVGKMKIPEPKLRHGLEWMDGWRRVESPQMKAFPALCAPLHIPPHAIHNVPILDGNGMMLSKATKARRESFK